MKQLLVVISFLMGTSASVCLSQELPVLEKDIFGVRLGQRVAEVERQCMAAKLEYVENTEKPTDPDYPGVTDDIYGCLNGNEAISRTRVSHYQGAIYKVEVYFKDSSYTNHTAIEKALTEKYGEPSRSLFDALATQTTYPTYINGQDVKVVLDTLSSGELLVRYEYVALEARATSAMLESKKIAS